MELRYHTPLTPEEQLAHGLPEPWPLALADRVRWGELDRLNHVNNVAYLQWLESARIRYFGMRGLGGGPDDPVTVIRRGEIEWLAEMRAEEDYIVTTRCTGFRNTSFSLANEIWAGGTLRATFACVIVLLEPDGSGRAPLPDAMVRMFRQIDGAARG